MVHYYSLNSLKYFIISLINIFFYIDWVTEFTLLLSEDARQITKSLIRKSALKKLIDNREKDTKFFIESTLNSSVQEPLEKFLEALKSKKQK
jgi:hypothetical protein